MYKKYETIDLDLDEDILISLQELSQILKCNVNELHLLCIEKGIGNITSSGHIFIDYKSSESFYNGDVSMLKFYLDHPDIEQEVITYIIENQPVTIAKIADDINLSREKIWKVVDEITFNDPLLYSDSVGRFDFLFYNSESSSG